jgi:hypothetical protein
VWLIALIEKIYGDYHGKVRMGKLWFVWCPSRPEIQLTGGGRKFVYRLNDRS